MIREPLPVNRLQANVARSRTDVFVDAHAVIANAVLVDESNAMMSTQGVSNGFGP